MPERKAQRELIRYLETLSSEEIKRLVEESLRVGQSRDLVE